MGSVGNDESAAALLQPVPSQREAEFQVLVAARIAQIRGKLMARDLHVGPRPRTALPPHHSRTDRRASLGPDLARQAVQVAGVLAKSELAFLVPERPFDFAHREVDLPQAARHGMNPADHQVEVRVVAVPVRDDHREVILEAEVRDQPVSDGDHHGAAGPVSGIEADGQVIDGLPCRRRCG